MTKEELFKEFCDYSNYGYCLYRDGRVVMDDLMGLDHIPTFDWLNEECFGHWQYNSVDEMFDDWHEILKEYCENNADEYSSLEKKYFIDMIRKELFNE